MTPLSYQFRELTATTFLSSIYGQFQPVSFSSGYWWVLEWNNWQRQVSQLLFRNMWEVLQFIFYAAATASESHRAELQYFPEKQRVWRTERIGYLSFAALTCRQEALKTGWRHDSSCASSQILSPSRRGHCAFLEPSHFLITHLSGVAIQRWCGMAETSQGSLFWWKR